MNFNTLSMLLLFVDKDHFVASVHYMINYCRISFGWSPNFYGHNSLKNRLPYKGDFSLHAISLTHRLLREMNTVLR